MIHIVICDDDFEFRKQLKEMIFSNFVDDYILYEFTRGHELYDYTAEKGSIDIVFLDIRMPGPNGIEVGKILRSINPEVIIILVTNYKEYVFEGYRVGAFRYLIKPIQLSELLLILKETVSLYKKRNPSRLLRIDTKENVAFLPVDNILYIESQNRKTNIVSEDRKTICYGNLSVLITELDSSCFFRCHRSFIVNLKKVGDYQKKERMIILRDKTKIPISKANIDAFSQMMVALT